MKKFALAFILLFVSLSFVGFVPKNTEINVESSFEKKIKANTKQTFSYILSKGSNYTFICKLLENKNEIKCPNLKIYNWKKEFILELNDKNKTFECESTGIFYLEVDNSNFEKDILINVLEK